jgi:hypothetical protein
MARTVGKGAVLWTVRTLAIIAGVAIVGVGALYAKGGAQCPDTCSNGTCSNNANVKCSTDATCVAGDIATTCPCDTASNHGQHQSCVVHLRNTLRKDGCPTDGVAPCSARSTCGKPNAVLCCQVISTGTCTIPAGSTSGTCSNNAAVTCATDADCTVLSGAKVTNDAAMCAARGGYSSGTGSVCAGCIAPVACCVPSSTAGQPGSCQLLTAAACTGAGGTSTAGAAPTCSGVSCP